MSKAIGFLTELNKRACHARRAVPDLAATRPAWAGPAAAQTSRLAAAHPGDQFEAQMSAKLQRSLEAADATAGSPESNTPQINSKGLELPRRPAAESLQPPKLPCTLGSVRLGRAVGPGDRCGAAVPAYGCAYSLCCTSLLEFDVGSLLVVIVLLAVWTSFSFCVVIYIAAIGKRSLPFFLSLPFSLPLSLPFPLPFSFPFPSLFLPLIFTKIPKHI